MKKLTLTTLLCIAAAAAQAQEVGQVISRTAVYQQVAVPRQTCVQSAPQAPTQTSGGGAIIGAIAGGVIGSQLGGRDSQGLATMVGDFLKQGFSQNLLTKIAAVFAYPVLKAFKNRVDHRRYNGAALLGLRGLVFKSHGSADQSGYGFALERAYDAARKGLLENVQANIAKIQQT